MQEGAIFITGVELLEVQGGDIFFLENKYAVQLSKWKWWLLLKEHTSKIKFF